MECRGCGKDLCGVDHKMVASWGFCAECFQRLMDKSARLEGDGYELGAEDDIPQTARKVRASKAFHAQDEQEGIREVKETKEAKEPEEMKLTCVLCRRELEEGQGRKVGIWRFCPECYQDLNSRPKPSVAEAGAEADTGDEAGAGPAGKAQGEQGKRSGDTSSQSEAAAEPLPSVHVQEAETISSLHQVQEEETVPPIHVQIELGQFVRCRGCGRRIHERGSYLVEGDPFCPDCYYALAEKSNYYALAEERNRSGAPSEAIQPGGAASGLASGLANAAQASQIAASDTKADPDHARSDPDHAGDQGETVDRYDMGDRCQSNMSDHCQSCGRNVRQGTLSEVEGFLICRSCLATDSALAVEIARTRHRKHMQRIRKDMGLE